MSMSSVIKEGRDAFKTVFEGPSTDPIVNQESNLMQLLMPINSDYSVMGSLITGEDGVYQGKGFAKRTYEDKTVLRNGKVNRFNTDAYLKNDEIPWRRKDGARDKEDDATPTGNLVAASSYGQANLDTLMHVCKTQTGESNLCEQTLTKVITNLLYGKNDSNQIINKEMFGGAKPLFFFFLLLNSLCRDTLKNWNDSLKKFPPISSATLSKNVGSDTKLNDLVLKAIKEISASIDDLRDSSSTKIKRSFEKYSLEKIMNNLDDSSRKLFEQVEEHFQKKINELETDYFDQLAAITGETVSSLKSKQKTIDARTVFYGGGFDKFKMISPKKFPRHKDQVKKINKYFASKQLVINLQLILNKISLVKSFYYELDSKGETKYSVPAIMTKNGLNVQLKLIDHEIFKHGDCDILGVLKEGVKEECKPEDIVKIAIKVINSFDTNNNFAAYNIIPEAELEKAKAAAGGYIEFLKTAKAIYEGLDKEEYDKGNVVLTTKKDEKSGETFNKWLGDSLGLGNYSVKEESLPESDTLATKLLYETVKDSAISEVIQYMNHNLTALDAEHEREMKSTGSRSSGPKKGGLEQQDGGGGAYVNWFKHAGPNIFYLVNALYNLNVKGTKVGGDLFVVENIEEYKADFLSRMNVSKSEENIFDMDKLTSFFEWLNNVIQIVNANREIFDGKKKTTEIIQGPYKAYGITSERSKQRWVGPGSPMAMFGMNGLQIIKSGMQEFGQILTPIPNIITGGSRDGLKLNDISFIDVVNAVKGDTAGHEFIGGVMHNNNYEAALLVGKLFSHFENIQSALRARGQKLDDASVAFMKNALNEIKITVFTAEDTLKNISAWIRNNKMKESNMRGNTVNLSQMIKSWTETMRDLRSQSENMADNFYKIEVMVPSMDVNVVY